jgi:hypothetical protein
MGSRKSKSRGAGRDFIDSECLSSVRRVGRKRYTPESNTGTENSVTTGLTAVECERYLSRKSSTRAQDRRQTQPSEWPKTSCRPTDCKSATCISASCPGRHSAVRVRCQDHDKLVKGWLRGNLWKRISPDRAVVCGTPWGPKAEIPLPQTKTCNTNATLDGEDQQTNDSRQDFIGREQEMEPEVSCQNNPGTAKM